MNLLGRFRISYALLSPRRRDRILSVGCKAAEFESAIAGSVRRLTGIDLDEEVIRSNRVRFPGIDFQTGDLLKGLSFRDGTFDKVVFLEVLEHLPAGTEVRALEELHRVLKPGGVLVLSTPNAHPLCTMMDPAWWLIGHRYYQPRRVESLLREAGFQVSQTRVGGAWIECMWLPVFYALLRLRMAAAPKRWMDRVIDREYDRQGFQTVLVQAVKGRDRFRRGGSRRG